MTDITSTTEPKSDQLNYDDVMSHDVTVTVTEVKKGSAEQPVEVHLVEYPGRPFKPSKSMRRVLVAAWGGEASNYPGRRLRLFGDPDVKFGGKAVGGIRIRAMSHLEGPLTIQLTVTRGKRAPFTVEPLTDAPTLPDGWEADVAACESVDELTEFYEMASAAGWWSPVVAHACTARKLELEGKDD